MFPKRTIDLGPKILFMLLYQNEKWQPCCQCTNSLNWTQFACSTVRFGLRRVNRLYTFLVSSACSLEISVLLCSSLSKKKSTQECDIRQRRHRPNLWIWLVEQGKILVLHERHALKTIELHVSHVPKAIVLHVRYALNTIALHVRHALLNNSVPSLQINDVKLPHFRFRWQLKKTTINLYFLYLLQGRALTAPQLKRISPTLNNLNKMK